jgi:hypothetical protein
MAVYEPRAYVHSIGPYGFNAFIVAPPGNEPVMNGQVGGLYLSGKDIDQAASLYAEVSGPQAPGSFDQSFQTHCIDLHGRSKMSLHPKSIPTRISVFLNLYRR